MRKRKKIKIGELGSVPFTNDNVKQARIPQLPESIIFNILSWGSAEFLHNVGRLVSKSWGTRICGPQFIDEHLSHSNPILVFKYLLYRKPLFYIGHDGKRLRDFDYKDKFEGRLLDSSAGLMLYSDRKYKNLVLRNSITNKILKLPGLPLGIMGSRCTMNVAYLSHTGEFKLIATHRAFIRSNTHCRLSVLTVGADSNMSWRILNIPATLWDAAVCPELESESESSLFSSSIGAVVIYWSDPVLASDMTFFAVDLWDDSSHLVHVPSICDDEDIVWDLIPMDRELYVISVKMGFSLFCCEDDDDEDKKLRVWKMTDFRRSEWTEVFSIVVDEECESFLHKKYNTFIAWYNDHKILVYKTDNDRIMAHNFILRKSYFITNSIVNQKSFLSHTNSLVWFGGDLETLQI